MGSAPITSHPSHYKRRRWIYIGASLFPFAVIVLLMLLYLVFGAFFKIEDSSSAEQWLSLILGLLKWMQQLVEYIVGAVVFAVGFGLCGLLIVLAERTKSLKNTRGLLDTTKIWWVVLSIASVIGAIGVIVILNTKDARIDFVSQVLLVGPLLLTLLILGPVIDLVNRKKPSKYVIKWIVGAFLSIFVTAIAASFVTNIASNIQEWFNSPDQNVGISDTFWKESGLETFFANGRESISSRIGNLLRSILIVFNLFFLVSWFLWDHSEESENKKNKKNKRQNIFTKFKNLFKKEQEDSEEQQDKQEEDLTLAWVDGFVNLVNKSELPGCIKANEVRNDLEETEEPEEKQPSKESKNSEYSLFFEGAKPIAEQEQLLEQFIKGGTWNFANVQNIHKEISGDMLISGEPGSGRTGWVVAAAACSATRLLRTLLICRNEHEASEMNSRLNALFQGSIYGMQHLITCRRLGGKFKPLQPDLIHPDKIPPPPNVIIATSKELEDTFFKHNGSIPKAKEALLKSLSNILVTDIMRFNESELYRLPLLLGKIRLINKMSPCNAPLRTAVVGPLNWGAAITKLIGERLFSPLTAWKQYELGLCKTTAEREVFIEIDDLKDAYKSVASALSKIDAYVVILRLVSDKQIDQYKEELNESGIDTEKIRIINSINKLRKDIEFNEHIKSAECCVIVDRVESNQNASAITTDSNCSTVVIHLGISHANGVKLPIIASNSSEGLVAAELMTCLPYFEIKKFTSRNEWKQIGVPHRNKLSKAGKDAEAVDGIMFKCTPKDDVKLKEGISADLCLQEYAGHFSTSEMLNNTYNLAIKDDSTSIVIVKNKKDERNQKRYIYWFPKGLELEKNQLDLASADRLLVHHRSKTFLPNRIYADRTGEIRVEANTSDDRNSIPLPSESYMPIWSGKLPVSSFKNAQPSISFDGLDANYYKWVNLRNIKTGKPFTADVDWSLLGHFPDRGGEINLADPIEFSYSAVCSFWLLGDLSAIGSDLNLLLKGEWNSDIANPTPNQRVFWPELTAALMSGLDASAKGLSGFGRLLAFHNPKLGERAVEILILELPDYTNTYQESISIIFKNNKLRSRFINASKATLNKLKSIDNHKAQDIFNALSTSARQAYGSFYGPLNRIDQAEGILNNLNNMHCPKQ